MTERHRQLQFHSPFEEEIWVPRRDRIFVPSNFVSRRNLLADLKKTMDKAMEDMYKAEIHRWYDVDCAPGRNQFIVPYREFQRHYRR